VKKTTLLLGGARSGKSRRAFILAESYERRIMIATAEAGDEEMAERIAVHRAERDSNWRTIEEPLDLVAAVGDASNAIAESSPKTVVVVDCLTLWLSNLMHAGLDVDAETGRLLRSVSECEADIIFISNELGLGLVPETKLGRDFRDAQGRLNQRFAEAADVVEFVAAGLPLRLKP
jgi:adenosylcobinamide kinase / adenosylcobinamide-phosphate guanylyltransferase